MSVLLLIEFWPSAKLSELAFYPVIMFPWPAVPVKRGPVSSRFQKTRTPSVSLSSKAWFLKLNTIDILDQRILSCGRLSLPCRIAGYTEGSLASTYKVPETPPSCDKQNVSKYCQMSFGGREGATSVLLRTHGHRTYGKRACSVGQKS